jgi:hypothetical protein
VICPQGGDAGSPLDHRFPKSSPGHSPNRVAAISRSELGRHQTEAKVGASFVAVQQDGEAPRSETQARDSPKPGAIHSAQLS